MSLDKLTTSSPQTVDTSAKRSLAWLLPLALILGFIIIIGLLFGERLVPRLEVNTAPAVTLKLGDKTTIPVPYEQKPLSPAKKPRSVKGDMIFQASGWIEPDPYVTYVSTLVNGIVDEVHVLSGDTVQKGQLLATLVDDDMKLDLQEATQREASLEARIKAHCSEVRILEAQKVTAKKVISAQESKLASATDDYERFKKVPDGVISKQQLAQAEIKQKEEDAKLAEAESKLPMIEAELHQIEMQRLAMTANLAELNTAKARSQLAYDRTKVRAPMDGTVLHLHANPGKKRILNMDDPKSAVIVEMYDPERLQARIDVPLTEASRLSPQQPVELISDLLPDTVFTGLVTSITGEADLQRNTIQCKVSIDAPDSRLRPEMLLRAKFFDWKNGDDTKSQNHSTLSNSTNTSGERFAIYAPEAAIVKAPFISVWVVSPRQTAELRKVELSTEQRDQHVRVLSGLMSGERVIMPPHTQLKEGKKIKIKRK